jgi:FdhD protein
VARASVMAEFFRTSTVHAWRGDRHERREDRVAIEEPLEVRVDGEPFAITMRTPGADGALAAGFLLSERLIDQKADIAELILPAGEGPTANRLNVILSATAAERASTRLAERRRVLTTSACGMCGRLTFDAVLADRLPLDDRTTISPATIASLPFALRDGQQGFDATGGLHAAGLFDVTGTLGRLAEDVGRHNAVDKIAGQSLLDDDLPLAGRLLCVSGRASYEIVQKAFLAGIPFVVAVSAPSSLAIDLANRAGITLIGFTRGETFNVYAHGDRIKGQPAAV